jgi:hypothetical protein
MNEDVKRYLDYYCDQPTADYGVLIDAPWGAGKPYFIKQYFKSRDKAKGWDSEKKSTCLHASLYGVRATDEITDQFLAQIYPALNIPVVRVIGAAAL